MELEFEYADEASIPEGFRNLYTEKDGKFVFTAIKLPSGGDTAGLRSALQKERTEKAKLKADLAKFKDIDPDTIGDQLAELEELRVQVETNGKPDDTQVAKLVDAQVARKTASITRERDALKSERDELKAANEQLTGSIRTGKVTEAMRAAAAELKVAPEAQDDILMYAERLFDIDEDGKVTTKDNVGVTPGLDPKAWLKDRQADKPHWWPRSAGGGARGSDKGPQGDNPFSAKSWNVSAQAALVKSDPKKAEAMATAAGVKIGATKPAQPAAA